MTRRLTPYLLALLIALAVAGRAFLHLSTPYAPGMNGAYYLVQARAVLEQGALGIPDLPLTFHLHALLAWVLMKFSPLSQADAILWAVRFADSVVPPLTALPVFFLFRRWAARTGRSDVIPLTAAGLAILTFPLFTMVGDFQKNSIGLLWLACLLNTLHALLEQPGRGTGLRFVLSVLLLGLTHIGVLGTAIVTAGAILAVYATLNFRTLRQGRILWIALGLCVLAGATGLVLWKYDPARIHKLATALRNLDGSTREDPSPSDASRPDGARPGQAGPDARGPVPGGQPGGFRPGGAPGFPGGGAPFLGLQPRTLAMATFLAAAALALGACWLRRREFTSADQAVILGTALALAAITGPWVDPDKVQRLNLIAIVLAAVAGGAFLLSLPPTWLRNTLAVVALGWFAGNAAPLISRGGRPILSPEAMAELRSLGDKNLFNPAKTLIVTRHGAEWWTAWFLRTRIAQPRAVVAADWDKYDKVLYLAFTGGIQEPMMMGRPGGQVPNGPRPDALPGLGPDPLHAADERNRPPRDFRPDQAPRFGGGQPPRGFRNRQGPGGMGGPVIPRDANILYQSRLLTLAEVETPPQGR